MNITADEAKFIAAMRAAKAKVITLTPGRVSKGGQNPPMPLDAKRPPAPGGSGGKMVKE